MERSSNSFFADISLPDEKVVYLDVDGTLVADGAHQLSAHVSEKLKQLVAGRDVYLVSNNPRGRLESLAEQFGIHIIQTGFKKPDRRALGGAPATAPAGVIGDKWATDGLFANNIGARFIKVRNIVDPTDRLIIRASYALDPLLYYLYPLWPLVRALRPKQWAKNALVFAPLFFAGGFFNVVQFELALVGFIAFSLVASIGYILNDLQDVEEDARHPTKKYRPIASGAVSVQSAYRMLGVLVILALGLCALYPPLAKWCMLYALFSLAYSYYIKHIPVVEFVAVASFYVLRVVAGGAITLTPVSGWLILTTFFATLYVTIGKRYGEYSVGKVRKVLAHYPREFMNTLPAITATLVIVAYGLYSLLGTTRNGMIYTNAPVIVGVLWYLKSIYEHDGVEHPDTKVWRDPVLLTTIAVWGVAMAMLLYLR